MLPCPRRGALQMAEFAQRCQAAARKKKDYEAQHEYERLFDQLQ